MAKRQTIENLDLLIARWQTRLKRAVNAIDKLSKQRKRLAVRASVPAYPTVDSETTLGALPPTPPSLPMPSPTANVPSPNKPVDDDKKLDIPEFLRRGPQTGGIQEWRDKQAADQIREEQAATKKKKAAGRIATMKAKKAGDLKKMPLTGKAALAAIRG